ncbi:hypothetical protein evm_004039 [Chilo suppressalis]|nr:hypothetical protein evm_004039 [Chilo suppressalis]
MSFTCSEKWLLVEWGNGTRGVVNSRFMMRKTNLQLKAGRYITIRKNGEQQLATYLARSNDRQLLKQLLGDDAGPSVPPEPDVGDFSDSSSDWKPSDDEESDSEVESKRPKLDVSRKSIREKHNKKIIKPSNKVEPLIPNNSYKKQQRNLKTYINCRKRQHESTPKIQENNNNTQLFNDSVESSNRASITLDMMLVIGILQAMNKIAQRMEILKEESANKIAENKIITPEITNGNLFVDEDDAKSNHSDESNRSDDNVLISNRYGNIENNTQEQNMSNETVSTESENNTQENVTETVQNDSVNNKQAIITVKNTEKILSETLPKRENITNNTQSQKIDKNAQSQREKKTRKSEVEDQNEWVPIGSGKTQIHKDKYRKVKWSSYTIATRTLLLALFPRRTLATHSLTGKRSPAFQDKPAKMCLDPKKITDIIIEVMDRFEVKENLVRSIITTKCADESKMFRTRMEKKRNATSHPKNGPNQSGCNKENN